MLRHILFIAFLASVAPAWAKTPEAQTQNPEQSAPVDDAFVVAGDACGASQYRHLLGREYAQVYQAALLPADSAVHARARVRTLEYRPQQLNVVVDGDDRIIAIGCF